MFWLQHIIKKIRLKDLSIEKDINMIPLYDVLYIGEYYKFFFSNKRNKL